MLSLRVSVFVYENYTVTEFSIEQIVHLDIEEPEGEEKEIDEHKDIVTYFNKTRISSVRAIQSSYDCFSEKYNSRHLEFNTPPPKHG